MKCQFCGGRFHLGFCLMCGRSDNVAYEKKVMEEQRKRKHHNYHNGAADIEGRYFVGRR